MLMPSWKFDCHSPAPFLSKCSASDHRMMLSAIRKCTGFSEGYWWELLADDEQPKSISKFRAPRGGFLGWMRNSYHENQQDLVKRIDPEISMSVDQIIRYHGYPVENYEITTEDGYILSIQRIPHGIFNRGDRPRKPVLIVHCFLCSSAIWVVNTKDKNLPYILAESGYDVWLANVRGTSMGRRHKNLTPEDKEFWDFSFDEMARYDIPAIVDVMFNHTEFRQIFYIGHSIGTTIGFAILAGHQKFNKIFRTAFMLAPAVTADEMRSPLINLVPYNYHLGSVLDFFIGGEFLPKSLLNPIKHIASKFCNSRLSRICENAIFFFGGLDIDQLNNTRIPVYLHHTPDSSSLRNLIHGFQVVHASQLQHYDFGKKKNLIHYGQLTPPIYNVSTITAPIAIFWGSNDYLSPPRDISALSQKISNLTGSYRVPSDNFAHMDFLWNIDIKHLVYDKILQLMEEAWPSVKL